MAIAADRLVGGDFLLLTNGKARPPGGCGQEPLPQNPLKARGAIEKHADQPGRVQRRLARPLLLPSEFAPPRHPAKLSPRSADE
jgi:hypothetical protein